MGKSAKLHKRVASVSSASSSSSSCSDRSIQKKTSTSQPKSVAPSVPSVQLAKKRAGLKSKAKARSGSKGTHEDRVLGAADYVTLMLGGRRKAADEALKLPPE